MPGSGGVPAPGVNNVVPIQPAPSISTPGTPGPGMGMGGPMGIGGGPQTPLRHGSLPPGASPGTPLGHPLAQGPQVGGGGPGGGVGRQGSLPPHGMMSPAGVRGMGGAGGAGPMGMGGVPAMPGSPAPGGMSGIPGAGLGGPMALGASVSTGSIAPGITSGGTPAPVAPGALGASASVGPTISQGGTPGPGPQPAIPGAQAVAGTNLPPLPSNVNLNPQTTHISTVPLLTSEKLIPALSDSEISAIQEWMAVDKAYLQKVGEMQSRMMKEVRGPANPLSGGLWWEKGGVGSGPNFVKWGRVNQPFSVALPGSWREKRKRRKMREGLKLPRAIAREEAERAEQLVPIRIEFDVEHHKMRDTFIWNLSDPVVTPEIFAQSVVDDYGLAASYHSTIVKSIQEQLSDYKTHSGIYDVDHDLQETGGVIRGKLGEEEATWWEAWRKAVKTGSTRAAREFADVVANGKDDDGADSEAPASTSKKTKKRVGGGIKRKKKRVPKVEDDDGDVNMLGDNEDEGEDDKENERVVSFDLDDEDERKQALDGVIMEHMKPMGLDEFKIDEASMHEDMRILIKLDIIVAAIKLDDQFEWDLDNPHASPEGFAEVYAQELGLSGEFKTAIAHSIREQVQAYQKSLFLVGHPSDGSAIQDEELKQSFLPSLVSGARPLQEVESFTPVLYQPSDAELERTEKERDKDLIKRRKRNTRGRRGIALPDREPIRTYRTPAIGFPELDAATLALAAAANAPVSRRAAAAAASLTIANMVASENGERAFVPQTLPSQLAQPPPTATPAKEKKPKGLFKAPPFPQSVLRPRAHVRAPTESTAADVSKMPTVPADSEAPMSSSPINTSLQDQRALKVLTAKRAKELEREAKEKEFVDGQHPNYIDGVWHCSNCGCPDSIAIGRRKGPLGDKSQCGICGKFWHRHRRPRPVEYNSDPAYHKGLKQKEIEAKTPLSKKKSAAAALRAQSNAISTPAADSEPQTPVRSNGGDIESSRKSPTPAGDDDRAISPVSTSSSASEAPLAQKVKVNGSHSKSNVASTSTPVKGQTQSEPPVSSSKAAPEDAHTSESAPPPASSGSASAPPASASAPPSGSASAAVANRPPPWLSGAMSAMLTKYPNDRFEVLLRRIQPTSPPEWRLKCLDCPGKVYKPGPGETLSNFEVHLKNRQHRQSVNDRVSNATSTNNATGADQSTS
ncbi:hypothetical protein CVT24_005426 [Panaeolus cyanescens]|uniref:SNF5-domain-containing protein n=1 Tax=Panaeolus cyanescens TaxID=181874 RepID=A0A409VQU1_9AGAR|nr:hypothetical protein CVT24_005426 [Panaeolus cyanescens]